jgi:hypothetical protein
MLKVRVKDEYLADLEDGETYTLFGKTAKKGEAVEVDDKLKDKIEGNPTLELGGSVSKKSSGEEGADEEVDPRGVEGYRNHSDGGAPISAGPGSGTTSPPVEPSREEARRGPGRPRTA